MEWNSFLLKLVPFGELDFFREAGNVYFPVKKKISLSMFTHLGNNRDLKKRERDLE